MTILVIQATERMMKHEAWHGRSNKPPKKPKKGQKKEGWLKRAWNWIFE